MPAEEAKVILRTKNDYPRIADRHPGRPPVHLGGAGAEGLDSSVQVHGASLVDKVSERGRRRRVLFRANDRSMSP
jgi:hypothetical protein